MCRAAVGNEADVPAKDQGQWKARRGGQNNPFSGGHAHWYKGDHAGDMTFACTALTNWLPGVPEPRRQHHFHFAFPGRA
jgi:hypothetical protein